MIQLKFTRKATYFEETLQLSLLSKFQINWEISLKFCGLLKTLNFNVTLI